MSKVLKVAKTCYSCEYLVDESTNCYDLYKCKKHGYEFEFPYLMLCEDWEPDEDTRNDMGE